MDNQPGVAPQQPPSPDITPVQPPADPVQQPQPVQQIQPPIMEQPAMAQPMMTPGQPMQYAQPQQMQPNMAPVNPGKGLGIAALVTGILGMSLVALILGIIGLKKSKNAGQSNVPALIGMIFAVVWTIVGTLLVVLMFTRAQDVAREIGTSASTSIETTVRVSGLHAKAEEYYNEFAGYPTELTESLLIGVDPKYINNPVAGPIDTPSLKFATETEAEEYDEPTEAGQVQYLPYGCTTTCKGYVLRGNTGDGSVFTKYGLMNM